MDNAACTGHNPELWFVENQHSERVKKAREICNTCTVLKECFQYAQQERLDYGMFAALLPHERKRHIRTRHNPTQQKEQQ
jgi:hypothetical protein